MGEVNDLHVLGDVRPPDNPGCVSARAHALLSPDGQTLPRSRLSAESLWWVQTVHTLTMLAQPEHIWLRDNAARSRPTVNSLQVPAWSSVRGSGERFNPSDAGKSLGLPYRTFALLNKGVLTVEDAQARRAPRGAGGSHPCLMKELKPQRRSANGSLAFVSSIDLGGKIVRLSFLSEVFNLWEKEEKRLGWGGALAFEGTSKTTKGVNNGEMRMNEGGRRVVFFQRVEGWSEMTCTGLSRGTWRALEGPGSVPGKSCFLLIPEELKTFHAASPPMLYLICLFLSHPEINPLWVNKDFLYFSVKVGVSPSNERLIPEKDAAGGVPSY